MLASPFSLRGRWPGTTPLAGFPGVADATGGFSSFMRARSSFSFLKETSALLLHRGVAVVALGLELALLQLGVRRHTAVAIFARQLEHRRVERVETGERDELELVAHRREARLEFRDGLRAQLLLPVE